MIEVNNKMEEMIEAFLNEYNKDNETDYKFTQNDINELKEQIAEMIDCYIDYTCE